MTSTDTISPAWPIIAAGLRTELAEYGGLLALFAEQQRLLFARDANAVLALSATIEQQVRVLEDCRRQREQTVADFAVAQGQPPGATLRSLLPLIEADARPLLEALIDEVNHLLHRVRRTSRQNHTLLARTVEIHQDILQQLQPNAFTKTYSAAGRISVASANSNSTMRAAG
jgi:flagellar biosynthesis/type III secretory pathway chaperone